MRLTDEPKTLREMKPDVSWSPEVQAVMAKALQRKSADRYQKASDFGNALSDAVAHMPKAAAAEAGTMVMGAATAVLAPPPATRVDASAGRQSPPPPAPVASAPVALAPVKSKTPAIVGGLTAAFAAAAAVFMMSMKGDTTGAKADTTAQNPPPVVTPAGTQTQAPPAQASGTLPQAQPQVSTPVPNSPAPRPNPPVQQPAGGTTNAPVVSYASDLLALANSINDENSARAAMPKVEDYQSKVSLPADKAALAFAEAKANILAVGAAKGCRMMRLINRNLLSGEMKSDYDETLQACGSP